MAVYTDISEEDLAGFLADFDLGAPVVFKGIAEGVENSNFLLETERGRFILTIYERRVRPGDLPFFLGLMAWLAGRGYPSAAPVADRRGETLKTLRGKPAALVAFLPGLSVSHPTRVHCREAGEGLGWLHVAAEGYGGRRANDLGQEAWSSLAAPHLAAAERLQPGLAQAVTDDLAEIDRQWPRDLPQGLVHADFFPDNVFFGGERFAGAIDFYFAAWDALAYDIAVALNAWCSDDDGALDAGRARALLTGYETRRPLAREERVALPILARGAAMRFFITRLADWGSTPTGSLVRPKDPMEYARKLARYRQGPPMRFDP